MKSSYWKVWAGDHATYTDYVNDAQHVIELAM